MKKKFIIKNYIIFSLLIIMLLLFNLIITNSAMALEKSNDKHLNTLRSSDQLNTVPQITILTPMENDAFTGIDLITSPNISSLSNIKDGEQNKLCRDNLSIIEKVLEQTSGVLMSFDNLILPGQPIPHIFLLDQNINDASLYNVNTSYNIDTLKNKHWVAVYSSINRIQSCNKEYKSFHSAIDNLMLLFQSINGTVPKINLIGHSQGGLINMQYAIEHPYNVSNLISIGTPYNGSDLLKSIKEFDINILQSFNELMVLDKADLDNENLELKSAWNSMPKNDIRFFPISTIMHKNYLVNAIEAGLFDSFIDKSFISIIKSIVNDGEIPYIMEQLLTEKQKILINSILSFKQEDYYSDNFAFRESSQLAEGYNRISNKKSILLNEFNVNAWRSERKHMPTGHNIEINEPTMINYVCDIINQTSSGLNEIILGNNNLQIGESYFLYKHNIDSVPTFNINVGDISSDIDIFIADSNMTILNSGIRLNNIIFTNSILISNQIYNIIIENKSGNVINNANFSITETPPLNAGYTIKNGAEFTYLFESKYTNNYIVNALNSDLVGIFSGTSKVQKYNNSYLLLAGEKYYFTLKGAGGTDNVSVNINGYNAYLDIPVITSSDHHSKINFTPFLTCNYNFDGKLYDIYQNNILLAENVGSFYLQEDVNYSFIEKNYYNRFLIKPVYQNLLISQTITQINNGQNNLYKFTLTQQMRIDTPYVVMNTAFGQYSYDHGYFLTPGDYYLYVTAGKKDISIKEYDQTVNFEIDLSNETGIENNGQITRIAGKYGKTVTIECKITKTGYSFNGWMDANGKLFTNANGKSDIINFDNGFKLRPSWVANQFFVKLSMSNNEIFYWDGVDIKNSTTTKVSYTTLMQQLVNISDKYRVHANGNKAGHLFTEMKVEEVLGSNPHFSLTPQWITEKYKLHFYIENKIVSIKEVPYGSSLNVSDLNTKKDYYSFKGWSLNGKLVSLSSIQDFTPGIGANNFNITLLPSHTPLNYELEIKYHDSSIKRTFTAETKISLSDITKSHVGYTTKMLLINGSNKNDITNNNEISGLAILLFYGTNSYKIIEERALINYKITFDLNYGIWDGSSVANNIVQYNINKLPDLSLYKVKKSQAIFLNWQLNGTTVSSINNKNLGSYILKANFNTLKTNYGSGEINLTAPQILANITSSNATFNIKSTVNEVTFSGANISTTYEKMQFYVSPRSTPLTIYFANITIKGKNNMSLIDASNCPNLTVDIFGTVKLTGGNFTWFDEKVEGIILLFIPMLPYHPVILTNGDVTISGVFDTNAKLDIIGGNGIGFFLQLIPSDVFLGFSGGTGIRCYNLTVSAKTVNVRGGNGSVGIGGIDGRDGVDNGGLKANKGESGVDGGNATSGKDGTMGGAGGYGIYIENNLKILPPSTFKSTAGNGGHGGDGGHGGNGGNGGKGGDGVFFGATAKSGGNGGNSGSGGNGGTGGLIGINRVLGTKIGNYSLLNGVAGNGGDGGLAGNIGYGGQGGKRTTGLYASNGYNGIRGRNGTDGTIGVLMPSS